MQKNVMYSKFSYFCSLKYVTASMITYIYIDGFKAFRDFEVYLTPVTVVAGTNASGKSNLFDALSLLSSLATGISLPEVMNGKRGEGDELFTQYHDGNRATEMKFKVDMLLKANYSDELKQKGKLDSTRLRYELTIARNEEVVGDQRYVIKEEVLKPILKKDDVWLAALPAKTANALVPPDRKIVRQPYIQTKTVEGKLVGEIVPEYAKNVSKKSKTHDLKKTVDFEEAGHTLLSRYKDIDYLHIIAARQEMAGWMFMHLSPEVMRTPSSMSARNAWLMPNGGNLASAVNTLKQEDEYQMRVLERKLNQLLPNFVGVDVSDDKENNSFVLRLKDVNGRWYSSRVLSEGTLRILTLCVMLIDETHQGVLCFEEPENGVHPQRIMDIAKIVSELGSDLAGVDGLRQIIVNTHSPLFVRAISQLSQRWTTVLLSRMVASVASTTEGRRVKLYKTSMTPAKLINGKELKQYSPQEAKMTAHEIAQYLRTAQNQPDLI